MRGPDTVKSKPKHKTRGRPQGMKGIAWACFIKIKRRRNLFHSPPLLRSPKRRGLPPWRTLACFQAVAAGGPSGPDGSESFTQALPGFAGGFQVRPPAKPGACVSPERAYASLSGGTEYAAFCITCPAPCKRGPSRCVLHLFSIVYHPASLETNSESPFTLPGKAAGCRFAKAKRNQRRAARRASLPQKDAGTPRGKSPARPDADR